MRRRTRRSSRLGTLLLLPLFAVGASADEKQAEIDEGIDIYFRDADLGALSDQALAKYIDTEAGESERIERSFPDAPPQIPHSVEDMLPITGDDNECIECHHPDNVASKEDLPSPKSHFQRVVMAKGKRDQGMVWVVQGYEKAEDVVGVRYNCVMCHTPQATNVKTPRSVFVTVKPPEPK
jgi:cytochrome c-type protein NapB